MVVVPGAPAIGVSLDGHALVLLCDKTVPQELIKFLMTAVASLLKTSEATNMNLPAIHGFIERVVSVLVCSSKLGKCDGNWEFDDSTPTEVLPVCRHDNPIYVRPFCCLKDKSFVH
jgi:hypothetical protein